MVRWGSDGDADSGLTSRTWLGSLGLPERDFKVDLGSAGNARFTLRFLRASQVTSRGTPIFICLVKTHAYMHRTFPTGLVRSRSSSVSGFCLRPRRHRRLDAPVLLVDCVTT